MSRERVPTDTSLLKHTLHRFYHGADTLLIDQLALFLSTVVQNEQCIRPVSGESGYLSELLCSTSLSFVPHPVTRLELEHNGLLINGKTPMKSGMYGRVYEQVMNDLPIVIKTPLAFREDSICELYLQYVVINTILLQGRLKEHLIPSYGFFLCSSNVSDRHQDQKESIHICKETGGMIHTLQQKIEGISFHKFLHKSPTYRSYRRMMREIFSVLISLESSPFRIHHNDLHPSNIMISEGHAVLLDWGMTSFTVSGQHFQPTKEKRYHPGHPLHTGAYDFFILLYSMTRIKAKP